VLGAAVATSAPGWAADRMQDLNSPLRGTRWTLQTLDGVAQARVMEDAFIADSGYGVTEAFRRYLQPLLGSDMPQAHRLRGHVVAKRLHTG